MGRIERQKRLIIERSNKQILGESTIDKEEAKNLVMKRFGENPPTEEDFEDFEKGVAAIKHVQFWVDLLSVAETQVLEG